MIRSALAALAQHAILGFLLGSRPEVAQDPEAEPELYPKIPTVPVVYAGGRPIPFELLRDIVEAFKACEADSPGHVHRVLAGLYKIARQLDREHEPERAQLHRALAALIEYLTKETAPL